MSRSLINAVVHIQEALKEKFGFTDEATFEIKVDSILVTDGESAVVIETSDPEAALLEIGL